MDSVKGFLDFISTRNRRKRVHDELDDIEEKIFYSSSAIELEEEIVSVEAQAVTDIIQEKPTKPRNPRKNRTHLKIFWDHGYVNWSDIEFKEHN